MTNLGYDIIGDVHGEADKLLRLLEAMGYVYKNGAWGHSTRKAVFVGDLIDRGQDQVNVYRIVRGMVESGNAEIVMGNHEFNAIAFMTPDGNGDFCRKHSTKNIRQHEEFLGQVRMGSALHEEIIEWFKSIPLWLEKDGFRVVHACWHDDHVSFLRDLGVHNQPLQDEFIVKASTGESNSFGADGSLPEAAAEFRAVETLLKGIEVKLPEGISYGDKDNNNRTSARIKWWDANAVTYPEAALMPAGSEKLPEVNLPHGIIRPVTDKPVFIGHYWMKGAPKLLNEKLACVDYSAVRGGDMVAYRWSGENALSHENFVAVG